MKNMILGGAAAVAMVLSVGAFAQSTSVEEVKPDSNESRASSSNVIDAVKQKKYESDPRIHDMQINAQAGSLSRYSLQFTAGYNGASLTNITDTVQPNPTNRPGELRTSVTGTLGARYRITSHDSFSVYGGMSAYFKHTGSDQDPTDLNNPSVSYDHTYMMGPFQARTGASASKITNSYYVSQGETAGFKVSHTMKYYVPETGWIIGTEVQPAQYYYTRGYRGGVKTKTYTPDSPKTSDLYLNFIPSVEYKLMKHLNFNTSYAVGLAHYRSVDTLNTWGADPASWRVGVGYGITRDIYMNPYIAFYPEQLRLKDTWFAVSTIFSIF